jgi:uncharacterized coiled-coil DUF342 family protein
MDIDELYERSKRDNEFIAGSEIRHAISILRRANAQLTTELAECKEDFNICYKELEGERRRADELQAEVDGSRDSTIRLDEILTGVANALKGQPDDLMTHSHHDLAEVAQRVVGERDALIEYMKDIHVTCDNTSGNFDKVLEAVSGLTTEALANIDKGESK